MSTNTKNDTKLHVPYIPAAVLARLATSKLSASARLAAWVLASEADDDGTVVCTDQRLAALVGISIQTAFESRRALAASGLVRVTPNGRGPRSGSRYDLTPLLTPQT